MVSLQKLYDNLEKQIQSVETTIEFTNDLHNKLINVTLPKSVHSYNKNNIATSCRDSAFREYVFQFKRVPTINNSLLESQKGEKISYKDLCKLLSQYVFVNNLYDYTNHTIVCDELLRLICSSNRTTFLLLLKNLRQIIN